MRKFILLAAMGCAAALHAQTQTCTPANGMQCTPNLNLFLPPANYNNWNLPMNSNFQIIDTQAAIWNNPQPFPGCQPYSNASGPGIYCTGQIFTDHGFVMSSPTPTTGGSLFIQGRGAGVAGPFGPQHTPNGDWQVIQDDAADTGGGGWRFAAASTSTDGFLFYKGQPGPNGNQLMQLDTNGNLTLKGNVNFGLGQGMVGSTGCAPASCQALLDDNAGTSPGGWNFLIGSNSQYGVRFFKGTSATQLAELYPTGVLVTQGGILACLNTVTVNAVNTPVVFPNTGAIGGFLHVRDNSNGGASFFGADPNATPNAQQFGTGNVTGLAASGINFNGTQWTITLTSGTMPRTIAYCFIQ